MVGGQESCRLGLQVNSLLLSVGASLAVHGYVP